MMPAVTPDTPTPQISSKDSAGNPPRRGIYLLPNLLTTGCLFSGFYSIVAAVDTQLRLRRRGGVHRAVVRRSGRARGALDGHRKPVRQGIRQPRRHGGLRCRSRGAGLPVGRDPHFRIRRRAGGSSAGSSRSSTAPARRCAWRASTRARPRGDKRYFEGLPSPSAAATVAAFVWFFSKWREPGLAGPHPGFRGHGLRGRAHGLAVQLHQPEADRRRQAREVFVLRLRDPADAGR